MEASSSPTLLATDHELFVGDLIDQMRKQRQEKSRSYRHLPYFQYLGSEEVFEALDRVRQANLQQMQLKMQKDCSYLQHMDDMTLEGRNAETVRKRVQEGKLQGGFRQVQSHGHTTVCGCLDCQLRLGNKQFNSSFQYEQSKEALAQKITRSKLTFLGAAWHGKPMLAMHLAHEGGAPDAPGTAVHAAVLRGDAELVRLLCGRAECDTNTAWNGVTALDLAIFKGFDDGGEVLLQHGAPLRHFRHESLTEAIDRGSALLLRALLQQMGLYANQQGSSFAADMAAEVLACTNSEGNTPLHLACLLPEREAAVKILVAHGAEPNRENADGMTPLDCCVHGSNRGAWRTLRHSTGGQAKYRRYEAEQRSLRTAVAANCLFLVRNLHLKQDDERKCDKPRADLGDILHLAVSSPGVGDEMVQYLVDQGADVNAIKDGMSVLDFCLLHNHINETILGRHARLSRFQDYSPCMAVKEGQPGLVRYLLSVTAKKGGTKDGLSQRENGRSPLHLAAHLGQVEVLKVLLKSSCNVHEQTDDGWTALDLACDELARLGNSQEGRSSEAYVNLSRTIDVLLSRGCKLKEFEDDTQLDSARDAAQRAAEAPRREVQDQKERDDVRSEARKQLRRRREDTDEAVRQVEREIRASVAEEERKAESFKESEKLAKKVAESREVLQASWKGDGEKLPEYLSSKYYQIRIDVLRRRIQEKDQQIEEALKKMDFAEEDYLWLLRKKMRDLRLRHHPDKITDRAATEEDYKFYERITKAYDVLYTKEERDKYLEMSNHVEWLQQHGEEEEARIVERAIYDMEAQKKGKKEDKKEEESTQPPREHVERAKKKLQERREEETWEKSGEKIKALTLGTPNKCKAPVVTAQRFSERLEQCWIDIEWICKCAYASAERIEYELRAQAIDKGAEYWAEVYNGWESNVAGLGPFPVGTYEFMVRARNSIGWGEWSDVVVVMLDDPKWEKQQRREAEQQALREQAKALQWDLQQTLDEFDEVQGDNKLTIHRASNLLFLIQAELKRARPVRSYLPKPSVVREAEAAVRLLERWRDRKEAFAEWKQLLIEMKSHLVQDVLSSCEKPECCDLPNFLAQDEHYFGSLSPEIRNLIVQTLLSLDSKQVFKKLIQPQKERILNVLRRGVELGRANLPPPERPENSGDRPDDTPTKDKSNAEKNRTIFTKHQREELQRLADKFADARARVPTSPRSFREMSADATPTAAMDAGQSEADASPSAAAAPEITEETAALPSTVADAIEPLSAAAMETPVASSETPTLEPATPAAGEEGVSPVQMVAEAGDGKTPSKDKPPEKRLRTVHVVGLPNRERITRGDLVSAMRPFAEVDGARVGGVDALVRFTTHEEAKRALAALDQGCVAIRRSILSGRMAQVDSLTEESLLRASGKALPEKRATPPVKAAAPQLPAAQLQQQQLQQQQQLLQRLDLVQQQQQRFDSAHQLPKSPQQRLPGQAARLVQQQRGTLPQQLGNGIAVPQQGLPAVCPAARPSALQSRRISIGQLVNTDGSTSMFECPLCNGVSWNPKVTMCCQKVFCGRCLDFLLQTQTTCPQCHTSLVDSDGGTGGCSEQRVKKLDRNSTGVQAVLWRVYGNLRVRCEHDCGWTGNIQSYSEHIASCPLEPPQVIQQPRERPQQQQQHLQQLQQQPQQPQQPVHQTEGSGPSRAAAAVPQPAPPNKHATPLAPAPQPGAVQAMPEAALLESRDSSCLVVWEHRATDESQLTLKVGDRVVVQQEAAHGWIYGQRVATIHAPAKEGWFPSFCLPESRPPKPQQSPPPMSPPSGSTRVVRDYEASDPAQLSVREGEMVYIRQRDQSGWTFAVRVNTQGAGKREGWVPDWLLQAEA